MNDAVEQQLVKLRLKQIARSCKRGYNLEYNKIKYVCHYSVQIQDADQNIHNFWFLFK